LEIILTDQQSKIGKGMLIVAWVVGLGLLTLLFERQLSEQFNPNTQPQSQTAGGIAEVRLQQNRNGHYVTNGLINGQPVVFFVDTGATAVSIPQHIAQQVNLVPGARYKVQTANGTITVAQTKIDRLVIGDLQLFDVDANINSFDDSDHILLGMSALKRLEFTQKGEWLILKNLVE